ncbi:hypothetical protein SAMN02910456_00901 [Ruminococcaceae bacterium YRB3002]|nr:hypothetical protein SAMN02910456_00901 [Ruminococcaceae bacterium YRB3002]
MADENERKYEILPGVKLPDVKTLKEASSNFEESGVEDIVIRTTGHITDSNGVPDRATLEEIKRLQELGEEVAENEERVSEESRKKMQAIMQRAVTASASLDDLKESAKQQASEEKLAEVEKRQQEEEAKKAEEEEKKRVREERRALQKKQLEDARARAAEAKNAALESDNPKEEEIAVAVDELSEPSDLSETDEAVADAAVEAAETAESVEETVAETAEEPVEEPASEETAVEEPVQEPEAVEEDISIEPEVDIDATGVIVSDEQTMEDFGEFLDDGDGKK